MGVHKTAKLTSVVCCCLWYSHVCVGQSPAAVLHSSMEKTKESSVALRLAQEATAKMTYEELFCFWEEGSKNKWPEIAEAARRETAKRWQEKPEVAGALHHIADGKADSSFRLDLIDVVGYFKRGLGGEDREKALKCFQEALAEPSNPIDVRVSACHRMTGLALLMRGRNELEEIKDTGAKSSLRRLLANESEYPEVRSEAAVSLGLLGDHDAEGPLLSVLEHWRDLEPVITRGAALGLGRLKCKAAIETISDILNETPRMDVYATAAFSLGLIGGPEVIYPLVKGRTRFPTSNARSALRRNKPDILRVVQSGNISCPPGSALEAYCLVADDGEWQELLAGLPARDTESQKTILRMAVERSPRLDSALSALSEIKSGTEDADVRRYAARLLARVERHTLKTNNQQQGPTAGPIPSAPNN